MHLNEYKNLTQFQDAIHYSTSISTVTALGIPKWSSVRYWPGLTLLNFGDQLWTCGMAIKPIFLSKEKELYGNHRGISTLLLKRLLLMLFITELLSILWTKFNLNLSVFKFDRGNYWCDIGMLLKRCFRKKKQKKNKPPNVFYWFYTYIGVPFARY